MAPNIYRKRGLTLFMVCGIISRGDDVYSKKQIDDKPLDEVTYQSKRIAAILAFIVGIGSGDCWGGWWLLISTYNASDIRDTNTYDNRYKPCYYLYILNRWDNWKIDDGSS